MKPGGMQEAVTEWAYHAGRDHLDKEWLLHPCDAWVKNPHYRGPVGPHPEDDCQFDKGYEGVDDSTPPPSYCQEAWDYITGHDEDPISQSCGCMDDIMRSYWRSHRKDCKICDERLTNEEMP